MAMLFIIVIILWIVFSARSAGADPHEHMFMTGVFIALAYVAGFLDSRLFRKMDTDRGHLPQEADEGQG